MFGSKPDAPQVAAPARGMFGRLKDRLLKTRDTLAVGFGNLLLGEKEIDANALEDLEVTLLSADVGVAATRRIIDALTARVKRRELSDSRALHKALADELVAILEPSQHRRFTLPPDAAPCIVLIVGVNGVGKTTTIGKLGMRLCDEGRSVLFAAGDTFRAAAVEQLQIWGERISVPVIAQAQGSDAASVIFDALQAARSRNIDVVLADTAGRLHNRVNLMGELEKIGRIMRRFDAAAPHEVLLVLDAITGQNALNQAREFMAVVNVTGIVLTKLDGTAKGGIAFALSEATRLPIYFVGVGEAAEDLRPFDAREFVDALLDQGANVRGPNDQGHGR